MVSSLLQDLRHSLRLMSRAPGFTAAAVVMLTLAIGATTAVFSIVYGVLLRPLPYPGADRIVRLSEEHPGGVSLIRDDRLSNLTFDAWVGNTQTIDSLMAYSSGRYVVDNGKGTERIEGAAISPSASSLLGLVPAVGRVFRAEEATEG